MDLENTEGIIRLLDSSGTSVLDSVSCLYEDSFTIETFGDLIKYHQESQPKGTRNFIIARVQTWDPKQPDKAFYSYYAAHHLNKILFQTQLYLNKKLIHRLHVLNPLTNSDIVGSVQYFMVRPASAQKKPKLTPPSLKSSNKEQIKPSIEPVSKSTLAELSKEPRRNSVSKAIKPLFLSINGGSKSGLLSGVPPPSPHVKEVEKNQIANWTLNTPLVSEMTFEEGNTSQSKSATFWKKKNSIDIVIPVDNTEKADGDMSPQSSDGSRFLRPSTSPVSPTLAGQKARKIRSAAPPGLVTRFGFPVNGNSDADLNASGCSKFESSSNQKVKVDIDEKDLSHTTYSFANSARPDNNGRVQTFAEWLDNLHTTSSSAGETADTRPEPSPTRKQVILHIVNSANAQDKKVVVENQKASVAPEIVIASQNEKSNPGASPEKAIVKTYDAILFATDNDFLEQSKIRGVFKRHAVNETDAFLFEMPPISEQMYQDFLRRQQPQQQNVNPNSNEVSRSESRRPSLQPLDIQETIIPSETDLNSTQVADGRDNPSQIALKHECLCSIQ